MSAAAAPKYFVIVFVVSASVFVFELLALAFDFLLSGFLASMHVGVAVNLGGFNWEKRDGSFLEKIGKNFEV